jgi:uncharacterized protein involved in outer membrane biogenesis
MNNPLKKILIIFAVIISLLIFLSVLIPAVIDLSGYKSKIEGFISESLGKEVTIKKIRLSILKGIGAEMKEIRVGKDPDLIHIESMRIKVSILPLLNGRIEMKGVSMVNIQVFLKKEEGNERKIIISRLYLPLTSLNSRLTEFKRFKAELYKGNLLGDLRVEKKADISYNLVHNIEKLELEPLIKDALSQKVTISGPLNLKGSLRGMGNELERLEGSGVLNIGKGKIKGIEITDIIGSIGIVTTKRPISLTDFDRISGHYTIGGGYLKTEDLEMFGKDLYLKAKGSYGLVNSRLDFLVRGHIIDIPVEIKIEGTGSKPIYHLKAPGIEKKIIKELGKGKDDKKGLDEVLKGIFKK